MTPPWEHRLAAGIALVVALFLVHVAWAQPPTVHGLVGSSDHDVLAQMCFGETGTHERACAAQVHIMVRRAELRGMTVGRMARIYSQPLRGASRRAWVRGLTTHGRRPAGFPERASWSATQARFRALHAFVGDVLTGAEPDPCPEALHFAGPAWLDGDAPTGFEPCCEDVHERQRMFCRVPAGGAS
ncbi:MAG: hypothetical protein AAGH15_19940 [Myxococcota bacterium]